MLLVEKAELRVVDHLLLLVVKDAVVTFVVLIGLLLDVGVAVAVAVSVKLGVVVVGFGDCCFGTLLRTLGGGGGGVFGLVGAAFALWGGGGELGVAVGCRGALLGAAFLGGFGAGGDFVVGVIDFGVGGFGLGGLGALFGGGFDGGGFVVAVGVSVGESFALGLLGADGHAGRFKIGAVHELLFDDEPGGVGGFSVGEAGELGELVGVDLRGVVSFARARQE